MLVALHKPDRCPVCGSARVLRIYYGYPSDEIWGRMEAGMLVAGGCFLEPWQPDWDCGECGYRWFVVDDPAKRTYEDDLANLLRQD